MKEWRGILARRVTNTVTHSDACSCNTCGTRAIVLDALVRAEKVRPPCKDCERITQERDNAREQVRLLLERIDAEGTMP